MNFFQQIDDLQLTGNLVITITRTTPGNMAVAVILNNNNVTDPASKALPPLTISGPVTDLDESFFTEIAIPMQTTSGLLTNRESYEDSQRKLEADKKAKATTTPTKPAAPVKTQEQIEAEAKAAEIKAAYDAQMEKVDKLAGKKQFADAIRALPDVKDYPDNFKAAIEKRRKELSNEKAAVEKASQGALAFD